MKRFGHIASHQPMDDQTDLARSKDIELVHLGECDPFAPPGEWSAGLREAIDPRTSDLDGFVTDHPALAMRLLGMGWPVGVFDRSAEFIDGGLIFGLRWVSRGFHVYETRTGVGRVTFRLDGEAFHTTFVP